MQIRKEMIMTKEFNQIKYINEFNKENYKQFSVRISKEEKEELDNLLKSYDISNADFLRNSIENFKDKIKTKGSENMKSEQNYNQKNQIQKIDNGCQNYKDAYKTNHPKFFYLGNWLEKESSIFKSEALNKNSNKPNFKRGEIIRVDFGINIGSELSNTHFAIVLNDDDNINVDNITVLPLTSKPGYKRLYVGNILKPFNQSGKYSNKGYALITQITTISKKKIFNDNIKCYCNAETLKKIDDEIIKFLTKKLDTTIK